MTRRHMTWMLGLLLLTTCGSVYAQARMVVLGTAHVDGAVDHDSIRVGRGAYRAIQLRVTGGAINFDRVIVRYGNGTQEELAIRSQIPAGGRTRIIDLPGERRVIQSVDLWYAKAQWRTRPKVTLYGIR
jgi:hypothetical protein